MASKCRPDDGAYHNHHVFQESNNIHHSYHFRRPSNPATWLFLDVSLRNHKAEPAMGPLTIRKTETSPTRPTRMTGPEVGRLVYLL